MKKILLMSSLFASVLAFEASAESKKNVEILDFGNSTGYPFSTAARVGDLLFLSGSLGIAPGKEGLVPGGIRAETVQVMENIKANTEASGYQMKDIVKCTVFLADMAEFGTFNEVYRTYFSKPYPTRSTIAALGLAADARVEVECIAAK